VHHDVLQALLGFLGEFGVEADGAGFVVTTAGVVNLS
jgi:hypothetical protein